jgi:S-formylglutathione hydrolase FrmB
MQYRSLVGFVLVLFSTVLAGKSQRESIPSASMEKDIKATVVIPESYHDSTKSNTKFPTLYLLHGYSQDHTVWNRILPIEELADKYGFLIVGLDGGFNSWYIDSPVKNGSKYETFVAVEAVAYIDSVYRTIPHKDGRAILGSSMGGHGALTIVARHPDVFSAASSISGIMDLTEFPTQWDITSVLGSFRNNRQIWLNHSFVGLAEVLRGTRNLIVLDCGQSDFALGGNRKAHRILEEFGVAHNYWERPGGHTPNYVADSFEFHLLLFSRRLRTALKK